MITIEGRVLTGGRIMASSSEKTSGCYRRILRALGLGHLDQRTEGQLFGAMEFGATKIRIRSNVRGILVQDPTLEKS